MIKRPLLGWVVSLVLGMLCYRLKIMYMIELGFLGWLVLLLFDYSAHILVPYKFRKRIGNKYLFTKEDWHRYLWPVFFILGFLCMVHAKQVSPLESELTNSLDGSMYGIVSDMKQKGDTITLLIKNIKVFQEENNQWYEEDSKAVVYTKLGQEYSIGNQLLIHGTILALSKATNPGQFDEYSYYKAKNVICKVFADEIEITNHKISFLLDSIYRVRCRLVAQITALLPEEEAGLMSAILFGDKTLLSEEIRLLYQKNGFAHIMAVSGLHISLLGYGLYQLLRKLTVPVGISTLVPVVILVFYGALVGFTVSACRAIFMFALMMLSVKLGRWYDMGSALCLAAILLLLKSPLQLFEPGFLLSFASVTGITVLYPKLCEAFIKKEDKWEKVKKSLLLSASTQLLTLPLTCYFYYEISIYSLLINLILLPLCSMLVLTSLTACLLSFLSISLGQFLIGGSYYILQFFSFILHIPEKLPYHLILIGRLPILNILAYYLILSGCYFCYRIERKRFGWFGLVFLLLFLQVKLPKELSITCLDVSQGDSIVITSQEQVVMIDGGSMDVDKIYEYRIKPYLKSKGIRYIDTVFITHADEDHISGILECLEQMSSHSIAMKDYDGEIIIGRIIISKLNFYDEAYQKLIQLAKEKQVTIQGMTQDQVLEIGGVTYTALYPAPEISVENRNNTSLVLWSKYGEFDGLFLGDVDQGVEEAIVGKYYVQVIGESFNFLKVAHHGSGSSSSEKMLEAVKPEIAVISVGRNNRYGHPHEETLVRLQRCGCWIRKTSEEGAIELRYRE